MKKIYMLTVFVVIGFIGACYTHYEYGSTQYAVKNKEILTTENSKIKSFKQLSALAQDNVPEAQGRLAQEYYDGIYLSGNDKKAKYWAERGVENKDPVATMILARMNFYGESQPQDKLKAIMLLESIQDQRIDAKYLLGRIYLSSGGSKERERGLSYLKQASDLGMPLAQYEYGRFIALNHEQAKGDDGVVLSDIEIREQSAKYIELSASQEYPKAVTALGLYYIYGYGIDKDYSRGISLIKQAAGVGDKDAIGFVEMAEDLSDLEALKFIEGSDI